MIAVRRARAGVGASWCLNHSREPNGSMAGSAALAGIALMQLGRYVRLSLLSPAGRDGRASASEGKGVGLGEGGVRVW